MLVFRDVRRNVAGSTLACELRRELERAEVSQDDNVYLAALLRAGELECAIADRSGDVQHAQRLSDMLAMAYLNRTRRSNSMAGALRALSELSVPNSLETKRPEGYAYYGVHPGAYARLTHECTASSAFVLGIRSIGTSLSAAVWAALAERGTCVERSTVRPAGHPWDRSLDFRREEHERVMRHGERGSEFIIVDEGPGMSGSTLLCVAELLIRAGIPRERITIYCSRAPEVEKLLAKDARRRWARLRVRVADSQLRPNDHALTELSAGSWRNYLLKDAARFPACWIEQERLKFLSESEQRFYKFAGLKPYGCAILKDGQHLFDAGFCPQPVDYSGGFISYHWVPGRPLRHQDLTARQIERMASYCAYRARMASAESDQAPALEHMARVNVRERLNIELPTPFRLPVGTPVIPDSRMLPHEWVQPEDPESPALKTDAHDGDGHLFPGPTDIAWDVAGAIVEWHMSATQMRHFLSSYRKHARGKQPEALGNYLVAYCAFRIGYIELARASARALEHTRLAASAQYYDAELRRWLREMDLTSSEALCPTAS